MSGGNPGLHPLHGDQALAVSPADQVWLSASAGTGKTQVLTARVFRLLLEPGVNPDAILCLTFTKAGASEMANRINAQLAAWVRMSDTALGRDLANIGADVGSETLTRARRLFARVLDAPQGGLRIQTIHSFCQSLLASFPEEAGLAPGFKPIEDRDRIQLARDTLGEMLIAAARQGDVRLADNLEAMSLRLGAEATEGFLMRCAARPDAMDALVGDIRPYINAALDLKRDEDGSGLADLCSDRLFDIANLETLKDSNTRWNTKTGLEVAAKIQTWLDMDDDERLAHLDLIWLAVAKADGDPRKWSGFSAKIDPDYAYKAESLYSDLLSLKEHIALIAFSGDYARALEVGRAFAWNFAEAKRQAGLLDFDDLIRAAADLLSGRTMAQWIAFKLDQRFDHVLVDEAQDTNPSQWAIVKGLIDDYFTGLGSKADRYRTLFTVGDFKQAIFGFQGTSPQYYAAARVRIGQQAMDAGQAFLELSLDRSFRSTQPVLDMVDAVLDQLGPASLGILDDELPRHEGRKGPGCVELWRPIGEGLEDQDDGGEGEDAEEWLSGADRRFAEQLADRIAGWLDPQSPQRLWLERRSDGSAGWAGAGDIMVLLRRRGDLASLIVARLYASGVPVAGIDRLRLGQPLAVQDLIAAIRFALQPLDDLTCAALLVSPLGGWTQEDLLHYGYRPEKRSLWPHLRDQGQSDPALRARLDPLYALLGMADYGTAYDFLEQVLTGPIQGRARLVARLGEEALDPIAELLSLAQKFAASHDGGLQAFLHWFDAGDEEIKRELAGQADMVRVMTVHGSKGLQAPVVILTDACVDPTRKVDSSFDWPIEIIGRDAFITLPVYSLRKADRIGPLAEAHDAARLADMEEHWRLLYVAMTRAAERLYVGGTLGKRAKEPPAESWYAAIERSFADLGCDWIDEGEGPCRRFGTGAAPVLNADAPLAQAAKPQLAPALPDWALTPAAPEQRPPTPLAPSSLGKDDVASPPIAGLDMARAAERGLIMHSLFERLPALPRDQRRDAARRWLARQHDIADIAEADAIIDPVCTVIDHPDWADVFRADALAEAPIAAVVGPNVVSGTVDRLLVEETRVLVVDFKTGRRPPRSIEQLPVAHVRQMSAYVDALRLIFPGRDVQAGLLYTATPQLFWLSDALLASTKLD